MQESRIVHISCQELREQLREELNRFAVEALAGRLSEIGDSLRQGVKEDLLSVLGGSFSSLVPPTPPWGGNLNNWEMPQYKVGTGECSQRLSQVSQLWSAAGSMPAPGNMQRFDPLGSAGLLSAGRLSIISAGSERESKDGEEQDPDELGWLTRCRKGFRLTKTMMHDQKKRRWKAKQNQALRLKISDRPSQNYGVSSGPLNGFLHDLGKKDGESSTNAQFHLPLPAERTPYDMKPMTAVFDLKPVPPKLDVRQPSPKLDVGQPISPKSPPRVPIKEHHSTFPHDSTGSVDVFRHHPKTFIAHKEIGNVVKAKCGAPQTEGDAPRKDMHGVSRAAVANHEEWEFQDVASPTPDASPPLIEVTKTISIVSDASKVNRMSHGGVRALLKRDDDLSAPANHVATRPACEPGVLQPTPEVASDKGMESETSRDWLHASSTGTSVSSMLSKGKDLVAHKAQSCRMRCLRLLWYFTSCFGLILTSPADLVESYYFDYTTAGVIGANAVCIGVETDWMAKNLDEDLPLGFTIINWCFCLFFLLELGFRLVVYRLDFFRMAGWKWNVFDSLLVTLQVVEETMGILAMSITGSNATNDSSSSVVADNLSIMRVLRVLRLVRIIRLVRVMHLVSELRTIVVAIFGTLQSLLWTMALLLLVMYIIGVYLTQLVTAVLLQEPDDQKKAELQEFYGALGISILSLFQAITNGVDWQLMLDPLTTHVHPALSLLFCLYVGFSLFALMNIVTGVFVESALQTAKNDKDLFLLHHMTHLFMKTDVDQSGEISWDEFQSQLDTPDMQEYFKAVDLDTEEARDLFRLIDVDGSGQIDAEEFVHGCLRLRGPAKAIDLATFMHDYKRSTRRWLQHVRGVERSLSEISEVMPELARASNTTLRFVMTDMQSGDALGLANTVAPKKKRLTSL